MYYDLILLQVSWIIITVDIDDFQLCPDVTFLILLSEAHMMHNLKLECLHPADFLNELYYVDLMKHVLPSLGEDALFSAHSA